MLVDQGHKRILLVAGESYPKDGGFQYVLDSIETIYDVKRGNGEIRRVNVNMAPLTGRAVPRAQGAAASAPSSSSRRPTTARPTHAVHLGGTEDGLRLARDRHGPRHGGGHRRRRHRRALRPRRLALRGARHAAAHPRSSSGPSASGPHTISVPRLEPAQRLRHGQPPAAAGERRRLPQDRRHPAARRAVHGHDPEHARDGQPAPRDVRPRHRQITAGSRTNPGGYARGRGVRRGASSSSATTARWTRSSATSPSSASSPASAPPATAWAARAWTSWTWPSRATSSTTATPTP